MTNIDEFIVVINQAIYDVDVIKNEKRSDYWDTISAIMVDKHFINMITKEMSDPKVSWVEAVKIMSSKCGIKSPKIESELSQSIIEIQGACKFLIDNYSKCSLTSR